MNTRWSSESNTAHFRWFEDQNMTINQVRFLDFSGIETEIGRSECTSYERLKILCEYGIFENKTDALIARLSNIPPDDKIPV